MNKETGSVATKEFIELKPKMYSFLVDYSRAHKKQRMWIKNKIKWNEIKSHFKNKLWWIQGCFAEQ